MDETSKPLAEKVIKGSFIAFVLTFFGSVLAYLIRVVYSRSLSIEDYGLFYAVFGLVNVIAVFLDFGFSYAIVYLLPKYIKSKKYAVAWNVFIYGLIIPLGTSLVSAALIIIFAPLLARSYFKTEGSENLIILSGIYLVAYVALFELTQVFTGAQKEKYYASIILLKWFLTLVFSMIFLLLGFPLVIYFAVSWALGHLLTAAIFAALLFFNLPFLSKNKISWDSKLFAKIQSLAIPAFLVTLVSATIQFTDSFFLVYFKGVKEVGVYNIAGPLTGIITIVLSPIQTLFLPLISHLMEGEKDKVSHIINKILVIVPFISIYFSLFIIMFTKEIVQLIFGQKWVGLVELPITILSVATIASSLSIILGTVILGLGKVKQWLKISVVLGVANITLDTIFIWNLGAVGLSIAVTIMGLLSAVFFLVFISFTIRITIPVKFYIKLLSLAVIIYSAVKITGIHPGNFLGLIVVGLSYSLIYFLIGYVLKVYDKQMLAIIFSKKK